ncbi:MAG: hypothetical protein COC19_07100 [SAR86 cluster bacterium]|uniref:Glutamate/phenylalanine/leucine/valine/L-tryptophan dehydrogenase C-terminal domain-containing protein n=1 Tax=SAR86 cluster bacterium TaxID=2030880 RepID=A0A2A4MI26_9GAMM|nr:MAG: hypothetical protein COC19_07100 [SAR86 cluster bacterium]
MPLPVAEILSSQVDVLAPCALGGAINAQTIKGIKAKIIAGAANNQLSEQSIGDQLIDLDILYAPDFVINAGGIIDIHYQRTRTSSAPVARQLINMHVEKIADTLGVIFIKSNETGLSCQLIAEQMAEAKFKPRD